MDLTKKIIKLSVTFCLTLLILGCSNDDENLVQEKPIIGTWKLIEIYNNPGAGSGNWNAVENGYTYTFSTNGEFSSTRFTACSEGTYLIESNELSLNFDCDGFTAGIESPEGTFIEAFTFESSNMIFKPTYLNCDEGCGWKFEKIN